MVGNGQDVQMRELKDTIRELRSTIDTLRKDISDRDKKVELLQEQLAYFQKKLFGASSEKRSPNCEGQLGMFDEVEVEAALEIEPEPDAEEEIVTFKKSRKPKSKTEELLKGIPMTDVVIDVPEEERVCPECGSMMSPAGRKFVRFEVNFVPAKVTVTRIYTETYFCKGCKREAAKKDSDIQNSLVSGTVPAALIPHSMATESVIAHAMYQKYVNAVPLYRQEKDWAQYGLAISRGRLASWINVCSEEYFKAVYEYMHRLLLKREFMMADETRVQVLKEEGRKAEQDSFMWLYRSGEDGLPPIILFEYTPTRARYNAAAFLKGFKGYLMTDGYQGYNNLPGVVRTCCWAHVRRNFYDAIPKGKDMDYSDPAVQGVVYCDKLFLIEKYCREHLYSAEQRHEYRLKKALPILTAFWAWLERVPKRSDYDPESRLGKACSYARNRKDYLEVYLQDGRCSLSNNPSENSIRPFCVGRRNWLFSDSTAGVRASSMIYSMVEMAKAYSLNVEDYLRFLLTERPHSEMTDEQLEKLMPWSEEARSFCAHAFAK